ncbi:hypothetical protein LOTGIDRAFT_117034 [Lottia gigantea]|uniref:Phospholipase A2-like central domain-containing protein n=1 Tax=Lottia gigantea TaxID=225164 RepID=V4AF46_LOTGI|nr:hypothetical protein LOTGIDRAFT_117034 [Lottia gigantea]ESO95492.1 hypothetical protein LOTGIDRAFT_117034 [Lottia gigantea]
MIFFSGTKWCGVGNISKDYNDLGVFRETDKCCREHDYCPDYISPYQSKYGLENNSPFVRLNCDCDNKFYDCLKKSTDQAGRTIGDLYFNFILSMCFMKCTDR